MFYEFYIDQFFLEHLLTGFLLITAASYVQRKKLSWIRRIAGSLVNAATVTLLVCLRRPGGGWYLTGLFFASLVLYSGQGAAVWLSGLFFLLLMTVCFGGILELLMNLSGFPLMAGSVAAAGLLGIVGRALARQKALRTGLATVHLQWEGRSETVCGLLDTGNHLEEPLTGRPVSIVDAPLAKRLLGSEWEGRRGFYLIPYHSIGTEKGWMRGVTIDRMVVELQDAKMVVERPVLAICESRVSVQNRYQMILHPLHVSCGRGGPDLVRMPADRAESDVPGRADPCGGPDEAGQPADHAEPDGPKRADSCDGPDEAGPPADHAEPDGPKRADPCARADKQSGPDRADEQEGPENRNTPGGQDKRGEKENDC